MPMPAASSLLVMAPMLVLLACAAAIDVRSRRIPNGLTFALMTSGLAASAVASAQTASPMTSIGGLLAGLAIGACMFCLGAWGGGDAKLLAGVGAWVGPAGVLAVFAAAAVVGMMIAVVQALRAGKLRVLFANTAVLATRIATVGPVDADDVARTGRAYRSIDRPLPYAVPLLFATLAVVVAGG